MCTQPRPTDAERLIRGAVADAIREAPFRIAPERAERLNAEVFEGIPFDLVFENGPANLEVRFAERTVRASYSFLLGLWAVACAAVYLLDEAKAAQAEAWRRHGEAPPPDARIELQATPGMPMGKALKLIGLAKRLVRDDTTPWPDGLPTPRIDAPQGSFESRAIELFLGAVGWVLLHEIGHVESGHAERMAADDLFPEKSKAREYEADEWAARWALDDAPRPEQYEVRVPAVAAALIWIALVDSVRRGSVTHPHAWDRFGRLTDVIQAPDDSVGLWLSGCMMKAFFRPAEEAPVHDTARDMFEDELIRALRSAR